MFSFLCTHPARKLAVYKDSTVKEHERHGSDFDIVTHHLFCKSCGKQIDIEYAKTKGGIEAFIERGRK